LDADDAKELPGGYVERPPLARRDDRLADLRHALPRALVERRIVRGQPAQRIDDDGFGGAPLIGVGGRLYPGRAHRDGETKLGCVGPPTNTAWRGRGSQKNGTRFRREGAKPTGPEIAADPWRSAIFRRPIAAAANKLLTNQKHFETICVVRKSKATSRRAFGASLPEASSSLRKQREPKCQSTH